MPQAMAVYPVATAPYVAPSSSESSHGLNWRPNKVNVQQDRDNECKYPPTSRRRQKRGNVDARSINTLNDDLAPMGETWMQEQPCNVNDNSNRDQIAINAFVTPDESFPSLNPPRPPALATREQTVIAQPTDAAPMTATRSFSDEPAGPSEGAAQATPPYGGLEPLTPRESEVDSEESTINLTDVRRVTWAGD